MIKGKAKTEEIRKKELMNSIRADLRKLERTHKVFLAALEKRKNRAVLNYLERRHSLEQKFAEVKLGKNL